MMNENDVHEETPGVPASAAESARAPESAPVEEQLALALAERDAQQDRFLRAQAELENYRKRARRERDEERKYASLGLVRDLLPVFDNLRRANEAARSAENASDLVQGIDLVLQQAESILASYGAVPIETVGQPFDPHLHEALQQTPSADHPPLTVLQELERGYTLHDRVVRPGKVIVSRGVEG